MCHTLDFQIKDPKFNKQSGTFIWKSRVATQSKLLFLSLDTIKFKMEHFEKPCSYIINLCGLIKLIFQKCNMN